MGKKAEMAEIANMARGGQKSQIVRNDQKDQND